MKKVCLMLGLSAFIFTACTSNPEGTKAETQGEQQISSSEGQTYQVNVQNSQLEWSGKKVTATHHGVIKIKYGDLLVNNGQLTGGKIVIDMTSLENFDQEGEWKGKLEGHLKSEDFFNVAHHPEAVLEITNVETDDAGEVNIAANLTIIGVTKNIKFPATITQADNQELSASADFNINRFDWGIEYKGAADNLISQEINFKVNLKASANESGASLN